MDFSPFIISNLVAYFLIAFFLGISIHASFFYKSKRGLIKNSKTAWGLSLAAGLGITIIIFSYVFWLYGDTARIYIWNTSQ